MAKSSRTSFPDTGGCRTPKTGSRKVAVDDVMGKEQRDVRPRLLHCDLLQCHHGVSSDDVEEGPDVAASDLLESRGSSARSCGRSQTRELVELPRFFLERHSGEHGIDEALLLLIPTRRCSYGR